MVQAFPRSIVEIRNFDGSTEPFDAMALQTRLIGSFLAAGRGDSSFMAEDIALAVEYTLTHVERPEPVFGRGELDAAVIRLLEEANMLENLPDKLRETASLRLLNPELTLTELAEEFIPPLTKSCLNHRLRKLQSLARELNKGEEKHGTL